MAAEILNKYLPTNEGIEKTLHDLLKRKRELIQEYLKEQEEVEILDEIINKDPTEWMAMKDAVKEHGALTEEEEKQADLEMKAAHEKLMENIEAAVECAAEEMDSWKNKLDLLSEKLAKMKTKKYELETLDSTELASLNIDSKTTCKKLTVLIGAAEEEKSLLKGRVARMERTLKHLQESKAEVDLKYTASKRDLESQKQLLSVMEKLSGVQLHVVDDHTVKITLEAKHLVGDDRMARNLDDCTLNATLKFAPNSDGFLEISDVQTDQSMEHVDELIVAVKKDKDLPAFILHLRKLWLSLIPLNAELNYLRKKHALDFIPNKGILQLIVDKTSIVCTLKVPKEYPHGEVSLTSVLGHPTLTVEGITEPSTKDLRSWLKHLENILGKK